MSLVQITYFFTVSRLPVMAAVLLQYFSPFIAAIYSMVFWKETISISKVASLLLAAVGCYLAVGGYNFDLLRFNQTGLMGGLAAAVSYAAYALVGERAMHNDGPWTVVFYALLVAAVIWNLLRPPFDFLRADWEISQWLYITFIVILGTIAPFGLYFAGINLVRSTGALITATLEPLTAGILAYLFLGETLEFGQLIGVAAVIGGVILLQLNHEQDKLAPAAVREGSSRDRIAN
jgi:drug/metabolite transporter (DMT)-like permease